MCGFTLIEIIAVIVILGVIGLITVPIVNQLMKDSKEKAYYSQIKLLEDTALRWGTQNSEELPKEGNVMALSFSDLQKGGVLKQDIVKDPRTGDNLKGCIYVQYSETYQQYLYDYKEDCDPGMGLWKPPVITVNGKTGNQKIRLEVTDSYIIPEGTAVDYEGNIVEVTTIGNVSPNMPGTYEIIYKATDSKGITETLILTVVVYDPSIPTIDYVIEGTNFNGFYTDTVTVTLTGLNHGEPVKKYEYRINTGSGYKSWNKIEVNQFEITTEGNNIYFQVRSRNDNGNLSETKESEVVKIDKTKPVIENLTLSPNTWTGGPVTVIVEATDNVSGIAAYSFDNGATWQEGNQKSFTEAQTVEVKVKDRAGHISEVGDGLKHQITIDKIEIVKPSVKIELVGTPFNSNGWANTDFQVKVEGTVGKSGIKSFQYCTTTNSTCTPNEQITGTSKEVIIHTESSNNKVCVRLMDRANQDTGVVCSGSYALDKTRPIVNQVTLDPNTWTSGPVKVKVNATDNVSGVKEYSFDEGLTWQSSSEKSFTGNQTVKVMVKDKSGNTSISNTHSQITIDKYETTKPTIEYQIVGTPINTNGWATANFNVNVISHVGKSGIKLGTFKYCTTTGSTCTPTTVIDTTSQAVAITTESSTNKICAQVTDNANQNSGVMCSSLYKLDKTAPVISSITKNPSGWTTGNITITVNATDTGSSGLKEYSYDNGSTWTTSKTKTYTGNTSAFYVRVKDGAGNISANTTTNQVTISNKETITPTIALAINGTSPFNANGWSKTDIPIKITSTVGKSGVKAVKYCLSTTANCTPGTTSSSKVTAQTVKITTQSATYYICATVTDNANQTSAKKCLGPYKLDKTAPTFSSLSIVKSGTYNGLATNVTLSGSDTLSGMYQVNISTAGYGKGSWVAYGSPKAFNVGGSLDGGTRTVYVQIRDKAFNVSNKSVTYTVYKEGTSTTNKNYSAWSSCSKTCGGGTQTRTYQVVDNNTGKVMSTKTQSQACNTQSCGPSTGSEIVNYNVGDGKLIKVGNITYFGGNNPNNYIRFNNEKWRIISFENGLMRIVKETGFVRAWWPTKNIDDTGSNQWDGRGSIRIYLNENYYNAYLSNDSRVQEVAWNKGKINCDSDNDLKADIKQMEQRLTWTGKVGLIYASDVLYASVNTECIRFGSNTCSQDNWLNGYGWTMIASSSSPSANKSNSGVMHANAPKKGIYYAHAADEFNVHPVIHLKSDIKISGGNGTSSNPYVIQ